MLTVTTPIGVIFECNKAIKGKNFLKLYDADNIEIASFEGVISFERYCITGGTWSEPEPTDKERIAELENVIAEMIKAGA